MIHDDGISIPLRHTYALEQVLGMLAATDDTIIVEVGSWTGYSTSIIARCTKGNIFAVDHWKGNTGTILTKYAFENDVFVKFMDNMESQGFKDRVHPIVADSKTASLIFEDNSLDLVFIDADHRNSHVSEDIKAWLPKVKTGGILCGHDCEGYYHLYPKDVRGRINKHCEEDYMVDIRVHPGVLKALHDCLSGKYNIVPNSSIWFFDKE